MPVAPLARSRDRRAGGWPGSKSRTTSGRFLWKQTPCETQRQDNGQALARRGCSPPARRAVSPTRAFWRNELICKKADKSMPQVFRTGPRLGIIAADFSRHLAEQTQRGILAERNSPKNGWRINVLRGRPGFGRDWARQLLAHRPHTAIDVVSPADPFWRNELVCRIGPRLGIVAATVFARNPAEQTQRRILAERNTPKTGGKSMRCAGA
jgi:hypothetical protein